MTKIIKLTKGKETIVDDEDYEILSRFKWYAQGLAFRPARRLTTQGRRLIYMYHQILGVWPWELNLNGFVVDHADGNPLNNRRVNLTIVTRSLNMRNTDRHQHKTGVGRDNTHDTYKAYIDRHNRPRVNIGTFKTREEALAAVHNWRQ